MNVLNELNGFYQNIQFTYKLEKNNKLGFLDVLLTYNKDAIETTVYRKPINSLARSWIFFGAGAFLKI